MRCGWRFGKSFLRAGLGCGHLTERHTKGRGRNRVTRAPATGRPEPEEHDAEGAHEREQQPSRSSCTNPATGGRCSHHSHGRKPTLDRIGARAFRGRSHGRVADGRGRTRRLRSRRVDGRTDISGAREIFGSPAFGGGRPGARARADRVRTCSAAGAPTRGAPSAPLGSSRPGDGWRRSDGLCRGRSGRRGLLLRRTRLRLAHGSRRQQRQRVEVAVRICRQSNAEVDVRLTPLRLAARADRGHDLAFLDRGSRRHADRAEVHERDRVAVGRADRQAKALVWKLPGEGDDAACGRAKVGTGRASDVHAAMLAAGIRVALGREWPQNRPFDGPGPSDGRRAEDERQQHPDCHDRSSVAQFDNHARAL